MRIGRERGAPPGGLGAPPPDQNYFEKSADSRAKVKHSGYRRLGEIEVSLSKRQPGINSGFENKAARSHSEM